MKTHLKAALATSVILLLIYLIFVFATLHFDIRLWGEPARILCAFLLAPACLLYIPFLEEFKNNKQ